ncbi:MAG: hypothetical protein ACLP9S_08730 [Syntrophales bacterium]|jgi:hypothetical protein
MRKVAIWFAVVAATLMVNMMFARPSFAQESQTAGAGVSRGAWTLGIPALDAKTPFTGTEAIVVEPGTVKKIEPMTGVKGGQQMKFVTDKGNAYTVFLGPKWFIEHQKIKFMAGDKVQVRGKKCGNAIIATEISKGDLSMKLRNEEDGMPVWESSFTR